MSPQPVTEPAPAETAAEGNPEPGIETDKLTSCLGCRKRKLKCSRDVPSCSHCQRLDVACVYDTKKSKPGLRPGAIEALSQRIEALENALASKQDTTAASSVAASNSSLGNQTGLEASPGVVNILTILAQELQKLNTTAAAGPATATASAPAAATNAFGGAIDSSPSTTGSPITSSNGYGPHARKRRRRIDSCGNPNIDLSRPLEDLLDVDPAISPGLPPPDVLQAIVNAYFLTVQPWIPVLHETQFRRRMHDADQRPQLTCILHAMVVAAARYVQNVHDLDSSADHATLQRLAQRSRGHVLVHAMDSLSVENLQALIIIAFYDIGSGNTSRAWSIVASMTRTVDYLRLTAEDDDPQPYHDSNHDQNNHNSSKSSRPLLRPLTILGAPRNWIEEEERRRVFWCIFLLDRFCSVATGWHTSITTSDVHRRLPADGFFFHKEEPVLTPYMNPSSSPPDTHAHVAGATAREPADSPASNHSLGHTHSLNDRHHQPPHAGNMANIGAFAYCIEAAESLSRVTTYFLLQHVDFGNRQDVSRWLTRFKELDLRLVHWKMYLPQRWKDSNVSRQPALVNMDPNLTLAHITHNTSTILLHQRIAYPDPAWTRIVKLPSFCSAETCQNAAVETATITNKYLRYTDHHSPVASQFAFCVYISARVLLVHWRYESTEGLNGHSHHGIENGTANGGTSGGRGASPIADILPEFWSLLRSLEDMDRRWLGSNSGTGRDSQSLAGQYAQNLKEMHRQCLASATYVVDVLGYTAFEPVARPPAWNVDPAAAVPSAVPQQETVPQPDQALPPSIPPTQSHPQWPMQQLDQLSPTITVYHPQGVASPSVYAAAAASVVGVPAGAATTDDLAAISHLLLDQQFMDRDRVISFEDSFFAGRWS